MTIDRRSYAAGPPNAFAPQGLTWESSKEGRHTALVGPLGTRGEHRANHNVTNLLRANSNLLDHSLQQDIKRLAISVWLVTSWLPDSISGSAVSGESQWAPATARGRAASSFGPIDSTAITHPQNGCQQVVGEGVLEAATLGLADGRTVGTAQARGHGKEHGSGFVLVLLKCRKGVFFCLLGSFVPRLARSSFQAWKP